MLARVNLTRYNLRATDALLDTTSNVLAILGTSAITNTAGSSYQFIKMISLVPPALLDGRHTSLNR